MGRGTMQSNWISSCEQAPHPWPTICWPMRCWRMSKSRRLWGMAGVRSPILKLGTEKSERQPSFDEGVFEHNDDPVGGLLTLRDFVPLPFTGVP